MLPYAGYWGGRLFGERGSLKNSSSKGGAYSRGGTYRIITVCYFSGKKKTKEKQGKKPLIHDLQYVKYLLRNYFSTIEILVTEN